MHELALAQSIVGVAERHSGGRRVFRVEVSVGHLRQVVPSLLEFGFELAARGTCADGAQLAVSQVPAAGVCRDCGAETELREFPFECAACGGLDLQLVRGEELLVEAIELQEEAA